eukprot:12699540-Alexandrium_andersonii.AAC.1
MWECPGSATSASNVLYLDHPFCELFQPELGLFVVVKSRNVHEVKTVEVEEAASAQHVHVQTVLPSA